MYWVFQLCSMLKGKHFAQLEDPGIYWAFLGGYAASSSLWTWVVTVVNEDGLEDLEVFIG